jgi:hypothetical protein
MSKRRMLISAIVAFAMGGLATAGLAQIQTPPVIRPTPPGTGTVELQVPVIKPELGQDAGGRVVHTGARSAEEEALFRQDRDGDGATPNPRGGNWDCDDSDPNRHGAAIEVSDPAGKDEDCDRDTFGARDNDGDGFLGLGTGNNYAFQFARDWNGRITGVVVGADCNDTNRGQHPNAPEVPGDRIDNNCDGRIDETPDARSGFYMNWGQTVRPSQVNGRAG